MTTGTKRQIQEPDVSGLLRTVHVSDTAKTDNVAREPNFDLFDELQADSFSFSNVAPMSANDAFAQSSGVSQCHYFDESDDEPHSQPLKRRSSQPVAMESRSAQSLNQFINNTVRSNVSAVIAGRLNYPWKTNLFDSHYDFYPKTGLELPTSLPSFSTVPKADDSSDTPLPAQTEMRMRSGAVLHAVKKRLHVVPWPKQEAAKRDLAIRRWRLIIEENLDSTKLGKQMSDLGNELASDEEIRSVITDTFARKATSTLAKRSGPILKYLLWHRKYYGFSGMPPTEQKAYKYIKHLQTVKYASTPAAFLSAIRFSRYLLDMQGSEEISSSERIRGACHVKLLEKRPLKQRRKLKVDEVISIHQVATNSPCNHDRYASSFFLGQLYTRGRYTGYCGAEKLIPDFDSDGGGYLEAPTLMSKTQTSADRKRTFLPQVAPAIGVTKDNWAKRFLDERSAQNMNGFRWLLPTPSANGGWIDEPLSVSEASKWLRAILRMMGHHDLDDVGTHSLKSTLLAWCAAFGVSLELRSLLGYHIPKENMSAITYSRDAQALPLRRLDEVLKAIRERQFFPDVTRSGRFATQTISLVTTSNEDDRDQPCGDSELPIAPVQIDSTADDGTSEKDDNSSDSGSSTDSSSSSDEDLDERAVSTLSKIRIPVPLGSEGCSAYFNRITFILHCKLDSENRFKCKRILSDNYKRTPWNLTAPYATCMQCFGTAKP